MNQIPNNFNNDSARRIEAAKKQALKLFVILLIVGIGLGAVISVGVVKALNQLGLTEKTKPALPDSVERKVFDAPR